MSIAWSATTILTAVLPRVRLLLSAVVGILVPAGPRRLSVPPRIERTIRSSRALTSKCKYTLEARAAIVEIRVKLSDHNGSLDMRPNGLDLFEFREMLIERDKRASHVLILCSCFKSTLCLRVLEILIRSES